MKTAVSCSNPSRNLTFPRGKKNFYHKIRYIKIHDPGPQRSPYFLTKNKYF